MRWVGLATAGASFALAAMLGFDVIGLQHEECLHLHGAVHMLRSPELPPFTVHEGSWIELAGRQWPLMIIPYAGTVKHYLLLLPFAIFGPVAIVARCAAALLAAIGVWGIATVLRREAGGPTALVGAGLLAMHPGFLIHTTYDHGTVGVWVAVVGLLAVAVARYVRARTPAAAFLVGFLAGLGVWNRANFVWFLASVLGAAVIVYRRRLHTPLGHVLAAAAGAFLGSFPLLLYELRSSWATLETLRVFRTEAGLAERIGTALPRLFDTLLLNVENLQIWWGSPPPRWQQVSVLVALAIGLIACLWPGDRENRRLADLRLASGLALLFFLALMLTTRLQIHTHHFATMLPLAFFLAALGGERLWRRFPRSRPVLVLGTLGLAGVLLSCDVTAARGMRATRGMGGWSHSIEDLASLLGTRYHGRRVTILDWGFGNNLYVLSRGEIPFRERYLGADRQRAGNGAPWTEVVSAGGLFLLGSGVGLPPALPNEGFLTALASSGAASRTVELQLQNGDLYCRLIEVEPTASAVSGPPIVQGVTPASTSAGVSFQVQIDGLSALSVEGRGFGPDSDVVLAGRPLTTVFGHRGWLTASVPRALYLRPGRLELRVVDPDRGPSNPVSFEVTP